MSDRTFRSFSEFVYIRCGIKLPPQKKAMLTGRLLKRMRALGIDTFEKYHDYVCGSGGNRDEIVHMIDVVTTNKTDFFREPDHFGFLAKEVLPTLVRTGAVGGPRKLHVWSAGCSSGQEPYTLAMVISEFFQERPGMDFSILATDISTQILAKAKRAIYPQQAVQPVADFMQRKYLMRGKGSQHGFVKIVPELRARVVFQRLNFMEKNFGIRLPMHVIFCRNVIIYFDQPTQIALFKKFYDQLQPGGYLFIGHSESLHGINDQFIPIGTSIYRKPVKKGRPL